MNHYETLGLDKDCSAKDIRKAYRKLAAEHHPDRGGDATRFAAIAAAHETLSDPVSRKHYDETGEDPGPAGSYSAPQKIVIKAIAKFATQPHGDLFESIRGSCSAQCKSLRACIKDGERQLAALRKRIDRLDSDNKDCKNTAGLSFVREVMEGGFASSEQQLNETKQQLLDHQNAIDIVDQLKCGAEPPDGQLVDYLKAMQSRSQTTCPPWERPDGGHHAGW